MKIALTILVLFLLTFSCVATAYEDANLDEVGKILDDAGMSFYDLYPIQQEIRDRNLNWTAGVTSVSNLSVEEKRALCGLEVNSGTLLSTAQTLKAPVELRVNSTSTSYGTFDWRDVNGGDWMTTVKNQASCGSCWAFADLGVIEARVNIELNDPDFDLDLSEQHLVSACCPAGNCGGGDPLGAFFYIQENGVPVEDCFPYLADNSDCTPCTDWEDGAWTIGDIYQVVPGTTEAYKWGLENYGPMVVALDAPDDMFYYTGGIYEPLDGWSGTPNHAVVLVGYNDTGEYWIIKNSWGEGWGEGGYGRVHYGDLEQYSDYGFPLVIDNVSGPTPVHNLNTSEDFYTIQAAIDDHDTLNGHIIEVEDGVYHENIKVNKGVTIRSTSGAGGCIIVARNPDEHVFNVTADSVNISGFTVEGAVSETGIILESVNHCSIFDNIISDNKYGIYLNHSSRSRLHNNSISNNSYNFGVSGESLSDYIHDLDSTNTVNGKPIYLIINQSGLVIDPSWNAGFLGVVNSDDITVEGITIGENVKGVLFTYTNNSTITNVTSLDNDYGIYLYESSNNVITECNLTSNKNGIYINSSCDNRVHHNKFIDNIIQGCDDMNTNIWDDGYPSGGNYWNDYFCVDDNGDGIGDVPYQIAGGAGAVDRYPLCFFTFSCKGDFDSDGDIDFDDFVEFAGVYGSTTGDPEYNALGDFDDDGDIDFDDFVQFAGGYGT